MRVDYKELMERLGVGYDLSAYETRPWFLYDDEKGISCSAEVRAGPGLEDVEAEIQFLYDEDSDESEDEDSGSIGGGSQQIFLLRAKPSKDGVWSPCYLTVKGESYVNEIYDWEGKGCEFFRACIEDIQMSVLPDIEDLIDTELQDDRRGGGKKGKVGKKKPSINPNALMGMKR
ncbi:MAG: hypothetical protein OEY94_00660 [Alphaproteobacteria bacterium]|nr:hypothetical protein [Alphaproteobacteria bacterium]